MLIAALILAGLAAALHVFIFALESIGWTGKRARATFGTTVEEAHATRELAFNQGFYNLFLAIGAFAGVAFVAAGSGTIGNTLLFVSLGSMASAALVLFVSSPDKRGAALKQGTLPLLAVIALAISIFTG